MIHISFSIKNPRSSFFKTGRVWSGDITKNKFWELQVMRTNNIVSFNLDFTVRKDHSGFNFEIGLLSYDVTFTIYDHRHWNPKDQVWADNE